MAVRKFLSIAMPLLLAIRILTGIIESQPRHAGVPGFHIFIAALFIICVCIHIWLNRKAYVKYFSNSQKVEGKN
jgi:hypothetical protein